MAKTQDESNVDDPKEMFAWMFSAGVPDPRDQGKFPNQPLIPPMCYGALSEMLYKMGARFHPDEQQLWVKSRNGPEGNFQAAGTTDIRPEDIFPDAAAMVIDQYPELAAELAQVTPETQKAALDSVTGDLLANLAKLRVAREQMAGGS